MGSKGGNTASTECGAWTQDVRPHVSGAATYDFLCCDPVVPTRGDIGHVPVSIKTEQKQSVKLEQNLDTHCLSSP